MGKIFVRERTKHGEKEKKPRFTIVGIYDLKLELFKDHMRKKELEQIAAAIGAELVFLKTEKKEAE